MDGLKAVAPRGNGIRNGVTAVGAIGDACVERCRVEARIRRALPMIANLRVHVDRHKDAELARTLAGLEHLAPGDREAVALLAHRLVNGMFHHLAVRLKAVASAPDADTYLAALAFVFDDTGTDDTTVTAPATYVR
jgi:glutamyl-tRNA reductase